MRFLTLPSAAILFIVFFPLSSFANLTPSEEHRAKSLYNELRCVVCQNQSIADSNAEIAQDLRNLVNEEILAGKSDEQIKDFLVSRYGDFILLKPRLTPATFILWFFPLFVLFIAVSFLIYAYRKQRKKI